MSTCFLADRNAFSNSQDDFKIPPPSQSLRLFDPTIFSPSPIVLEVISKVIQKMTFDAIRKEL